jgi:hypothetical protein
VISIQNSSKDPSGQASALAYRQAGRAGKQAALVDILEEAEAQVGK